ncbi:MAG TPA: SCO family protein [Thermoanaerobaculia bacterium]|nr:SCO family protein [Thermoanaerobaculia bacterium]
MRDSTPWLRRLLWGVLVAALATVAAVALVNRLACRRAASPTPPPLLGHLPDFTLTNRDGRTIRLRDLAGAPWVADFVFTRCQSSCPLMTARLAILDRALTRPRGLRLVSFTVDPDHDTAPVLAGYAVSFAASPRWLFLTGSARELYALSRQGFKLGIELPGGAVASGAAGTIVHSTRFILVDGRSNIRRYYEALDPTTRSRLAADLTALGEEESR